MTGRHWWSRPLTSVASAVKRVATSCAAVLVKRKTTDIMSHPIQCKTWCAKHTRRYKYYTPLRAVRIKGRRYVGSSTCSMHKHLCKAHTAVFVRMLDDSHAGYKRHEHYCKLTGARPSGLYRTVLHYNGRAQHALLDRYPVLLPRSNLAPLSTASTMHAPAQAQPLARNLGGGDSKSPRNANRITRKLPQASTLDLRQPTGQQALSK